MKVVNEKGKLFGLINIVDLLVLLFVLLVAGGVMWKIFGSQVANIVAPTQELTYVVRIKNTFDRNYDALVSKGFPQQLTAGDGFVDGAYIVEATKVPSVGFAQTDDGRIIETTDGSKIDIICTIKAQTNNVAIIKVGSQEVRAGKDHIVKTKYFEMFGSIDTVDFED